MPRRALAVRLAPFVLVAAAWAACVAAAEPAAVPVRQAIELNVGESAEVTLPGGTRASVKLLGLEHDMDSFGSAVRQARAIVEVNGQKATLVSANYRLPAAVGGVRIDCPITRAYYESTNQDRWGLGKDARLRIWPADGPLAATVPAPGAQPVAASLGFPLRMRLFASDTQMANEPVFVDGGEKGAKKIYYHSGLDFGGAEGMVDVLAATDGLVVSAGGETLPEHKADSPVGPRYDVVYILDGRGWYYRYSHMKEIDPAIKPGVRVRQGQKVGVLGKEGGSGGWSHLHFEIKARQPSGRWGAEEAYAYAWEAYAAACQPEVIALARPHVFAAAGDEVTLDGSRSTAFGGATVIRYEWTMTDGSRAEGPTVRRTYQKPGQYSEVLKVTDSRGRTAYDFCVVQIAPRDLKNLPATIHAVCEPTLGVRAGDTVTFKCRTFRTKTPGEAWDFGDGSPPVAVKSDGNANVHAPDGYAVCTHIYQKPGDYIATAEHTGPDGAKAVGRVWVRVASGTDRQR